MFLRRPAFLSWEGEKEGGGANASLSDSNGSIFYRQEEDFFVVTEACQALIS